MYELDEDYINTLKAQSQRDSESITTVTNFEKAKEKAALEVAKSRQLQKQKKKQSYTFAEIPVRPCTASCPKREYCKDFLAGRVKDNDPCKPELATIKKWKTSLKTNEPDKMKDEIGLAIGALYNQAMRAFDDVNMKGVVVMKTTTDKNGNKIEEPIVNPALPIAQKILKDLDVTLGNFLLTPKSQKETPSVQVNIGISADEVQARFMQRYSKEIPRDDDA